MGKPIVKKFESGSFLDGSVVYENDAIIRGEIEGNIELSDIASTQRKSQYNITVGPVYYGPDSNTVPAGTSPSGWTTPAVAILVFRAPRDMTIEALSVHLYSDVNLGDGDGDDKITVRLDTAKPAESIAGAYRGFGGTDWSAANIGVVVDGSSASRLYSASITAKVAAGGFVRVILFPVAATQPQAEISVTLQVSEDHAE